MGIQKRMGAFQILCESGEEEIFPKIEGSMASPKYDWAVTVGCFDFLHFGHRRLLRRMRRAARRVFVCIHDDDSIFRLKQTLPMQSVQVRQRRLLLSGLVDDVCVVDGIDPAPVLSRIFDRIALRGMSGCFIRANDNVDFPGRMGLDVREIPVLFESYATGISSSILRHAVLRKGFFGEVAGGTLAGTGVMSARASVYPIMERGA